MNDEVINSDLYCLVMAGGKGTRFWPESTSRRPKQYLNLISDQTLLSETLKRFEGLVPKERRFVVTVKEQEELAMESGRELIGEQGLIFEPSGRNTAPCILLGLQSLLSKGARESDVVTIVPSDHVILNREGFQETIQKASVLAASMKKIVTIGIRPSFAHTGFGYIQRGEELRDESFSVLGFKEKPDKETAEKYLKTDQYYWNAGMFTATIGTLLQEFKSCSPETASHGEKLREALGSEEMLEKAYELVPSDSIDYAVMEKSKEVMVVPAGFDWSDLGSWDALEEVISPVDNNTIVSCRDSYLEEASGNIIYAPDKFVSLVGVDDLVIVSNKDAVVVLPKSKSQKVKNIVEHLKLNKDLKDLV